MTDTLDRVLIAPLLGIGAYFLHKVVFSSMFIWFAPLVKGAVFWIVLVIAQIFSALVVATAVALPLGHFYRGKAFQAGFITGVVAAGIYGFLLLSSPARSTLNISLYILKVSWLIWLAPIITFYGSRVVLPRVDAMFGNRRADG